MTDALPYSWIQSGPGDRFAGSAWRGEFYVFQIGVYAQKDLAPAEAGIAVRFEDLIRAEGRKIPSSALECLNIGGIDAGAIPSGASSA